MCSVGAGSRGAAPRLCTVVTAPAAAPAVPAGTPSTAGSVSQLTASKPLPPGHAGSAARRMVVRPFNLLRVGGGGGMPGCRAGQWLHRPVCLAATATAGVQGAAVGGARACTQQASSSSCVLTVPASCLSGSSGRCAVPAAQRPAFWAGLAGLAPLAACTLPAMAQAGPSPPSLLQSPGTRADIDSLNDHIKASAASRVAFELHRTQPRPVDGVSPVAVAARAAARRRPFCAIRLC